MGVIVIGGSGFIGTWLVRRLTRSSDGNVTIVDKVLSREFPGLTQCGDVRAVDDLRALIPKGSVIINLAAEHRDDVCPRSLYYDVNVVGARNICTVARQRDVEKIIFTSSVAVYGFAPVGTDETGKIAPFNDYGRTKWEAEKEFVAWQNERPDSRTLVIVRPTVVFGEGNRGNVYNLLKSVASRRFVMVGRGMNRKSMAYVENLASFLQHGLNFGPGVHVFNYVDKPDFRMRDLVRKLKVLFGEGDKMVLSVPYVLGYALARGIDLISYVFNKRFAISSIRVKKFCSDSVYNSSVDKSGFKPLVSLESAIESTVRYEFLESHDHNDVYYTE